jgi:hypothetical protein
MISSILLSSVSKPETPPRIIKSASTTNARGKRREEETEALVLLLTFLRLFVVIAREKIVFLSSVV